MLKRCLWTLWLVCWSLPSALAGELLSREGCEYPFKGVSVCWEATGEEESAHAPFTELHLLPLTTLQANEPQLLADYTRAVYRQLLSARLAKRFVQEWTPVVYVEEAVRAAGPGKAPLLWIDPRVLRNSSAATPGVVDWDLYLIGREGQLHRNLRVRVESAPEITAPVLEQAMIAGGFLIMTGGMGALNPLEVGIVAGGAGAMARGSVPLAGRSLELLTQLAVRQVIILLQQPMEQIAGHPEAKPVGQYMPQLPKMLK